MISEYRTGVKGGIKRVIGRNLCIGGILLLGLIAFLAVKAGKKRKNPYRNIKGKKLKSSIFYVLIHMKKRIIPRLSKEKTDTLKKIYPGKGIEEIYYLLGRTAFGIFCSKCLECCLQLAADL